MRRFWKMLGPGILLAATSIGASHLVFSPQAGALFGYQLLWLVVACHLFKYPAFECGPRYAAATGHNLLEGYIRIPGPRCWALVLFLVSTLAQGVGVLSGVVNVAGSVLASWTGWLNAESLSIVLTAVIVTLLLLGGFSWLEHLNKLMMAVLALATVLAFLPVIPGPEAISGLVVPSIPAGSIVLVAAILGWMPTGIDVSVWHSFWTIEKLRREHADEGMTAETRDEDRKRGRWLRDALWDMRTGYALSLVTGLMFVIMGAVHLTGRGGDLRGLQFASALSEVYTTILGRWMYHVFMLTAFFAMFSTSYTVIDGFSRSFSECCALLFPGWSSPTGRRRAYVGFVLGSATLACVILVQVGNPVTLTTAAALISLTVAPLLYGFNLYCVMSHVDRSEMRPSAISLVIGGLGIVFMLIALACTVYVKWPTAASS